MAKFLNCYVTEATGKRRFEKVYFPEDRLTAASGREYELRSFRAAGSNGTIFSCRDDKGVERAVKFLHMLDEQRRKRFDFEVMLASNLKHPSLLPCLDAGEAQTTLADDVPFMVTELYESSLSRRIEATGRLTATEAHRITTRLVEALVYLGENGVVHRDIKPENIFLAGQSVVLGDLGIAKTTHEAGVDRYYRADITLASEKVGPILWMSPELIAYMKDKGATVDSRSDIFQVGAVLWFMLTGEIPRGVLDEPENETDALLFPAIQRAMAAKPAKRFQAATEFVQALNAIQFPG